MDAQERLEGELERVREELDDVRARCRSLEEDRITLDRSTNNNVHEAGPSTLTLGRRGSAAGDGGLAVSLHFLQYIYHLSVTY